MPTGNGIDGNSNAAGNLEKSTQLKTEDIFADMIRYDLGSYLGQTLQTIFLKKDEKKTKRFTEMLQRKPPTMRLIGVTLY